MARLRRADHGGRYVDGGHVPEPPGGGERELPGAGADVHDGRGRAQAVRLEHGQVLVRLGVSLLAVEARDEGRVKVFRAGVRQFVDPP